MLYAADVARKSDSGRRNREACQRHPYMLRVPCTFRLDQRTRGVLRTFALALVRQSWPGAVRVSFLGALLMLVPWPEPKVCPSNGLRHPYPGHGKLSVRSIPGSVRIARGLVDKRLCETANPLCRIRSTECAMKLSTIACEIDHNGTDIYSQSRMSLLISLPVTLAGKKNAHHYQSAISGEFTVSKPMNSVGNGINRFGSLDPHTARLTGQEVRHRYQTVLLWCVGSTKVDLGGSM